jgi:hypothetical protein
MLTMFLKHKLIIQFIVIIIGIIRKTEISKPARSRGSQRFSSPLIQIVQLIHTQPVCSYTSFAKFLKSIVKFKDRYPTDAFIARLTAWSFELPNILLAKNETLSCESIQCFVNPVLKIVKHFISNSFSLCMTEYSKDIDIWLMEFL